MVGFSVEEEQTKEKDSFEFHAHHKRSKRSNLDIFNNIVHDESPPTGKKRKGKSPLHRANNDGTDEPSSTNRASLEKDIEELHMRLEQEKSVRIMLERAMGRVSSTLSPGHRHVAVQVNEKVPVVEKPSFARTLKDHLYQCPSKLSEELVRCMAAIYCWLQTGVSIKPEKHRSPLLSRSSTNVILPRRGSADSREWSCKSTLEISWLSTDKDQFSHASYAINSYRVLVEQLERVNASQMDSDAQVAFWINVYNSLIMHAYLAYGIPQGSLRRIALFHKAAYNIGGYVISVNAIEQSIFCTRTPRVGRWFETIISTALRKKSGENKQVSSRYALQTLPLLCFALCTGAASDPVLKVYTSTDIKEEMELSMKEFLQTNVVVKKSKKVFLPKVLERYAKEVCLSPDDLLNWVAENVDKKLQDSIKKCVDSNSKKKASLIIEWLPYNTRFQYKFAKDLTEKPWWV
ncbi:hypothetical protein ACHQM5_001428 [Ranunculus cassubicifolius]